MSRADPVPASARSEPRFEQIRGLTEVSRALTYATSLASVLRLAVDRAAELLEAEQAVIMLAGEDGSLHVRAAHGVDEDRVREFSEPLDETLVQRLQGLFGGVDEEAFLGVPLVAQGKVTGLLAVLRPEGEPRTDADEWLLSAVADQAAVALENARLDEEIRRDLQERTVAAEGVAEASEAALSTLAHDLRSPLHVIDSYSELIELGLLGPITERQRDALERIRLSGRHLVAVLESVLEMARLNAGFVRLETESVPVADVAKEAAQIVLHTAAARNQSLELELSPAPVVRADHDRMRQILVNLLGNAVKYTPVEGSIRLHAAVIEDGETRWGTVSVSDTGPGVAPDQLEAIFQPYFRGAGSASEPGSGLGLAICRELAHHMGGHVEVQCGAGGGSTFTLRLPLVAAGAAKE